MPGVFLGQIYRDGYEFYEVQSPSGKVYTVNPNNVYCYAEGRAMLRERRAQQLVEEGYEVRLLSSGAYRVFCAKKHGEMGGYRCEHLADGEFFCNCPAFAHDGQCKHTLGWPGLLHAKASQAAEQGRDAHAATYINLAADPATLPESLKISASMAQRFAASGLNPDQDFA